MERTPINPETYDAIYVNDKPLIFTGNAEHYRAQHPEAADYSLWTATDPDSLHDAVRRLEQETDQGMLIEARDIRPLHENLSSAFQEIEAAGGLVTDPDGNLLMIYRRKKWDLPKGKVDAGETVEKAAVREVLEETGLPKVRLLELIGKSRHIYKQAGLHILKTTCWFAMEAGETYPLIPQQEEAIIKAEWADVEQVKTYLRNSYETIRSVIRKAGFLRN